MSITGIVFEGESAFFLLKNADNGPDVRVPVDEHTWSFDDSEFYFRVTDVCEKRRIKAEAEAGSDAVGYDEPEEQDGDESELGSLAEFIDYTEDADIPVTETPNSKALEEAEKRIKEERRERRKRKLRKEIEAEMESEQKEPDRKARRRILIEFSDEEEEKTRKLRQKLRQSVIVKLKGFASNGQENKARGFPRRFEG
ncbi:hypothetical protein AAVH_14424 [Aphelenchoides avenae]|nr:hypothetical protein AAVH_14424 [Aphelenchus avenae]